MWIQLLPSACVIIRATPDEAKWASSILKIEDKAAMEARKYMVNVPKGGKILTLDLSWRDPSGRICFPCGLLPVICKAAHKVNITVEVVDKREIPPQSAPFEELLNKLMQDHTGRYYQAEALTAIANGTSESAEIQHPLKGRGIIKIATGGGKGWIAGALPIVFEGRWCFAVHRSHLAADIAERFERMTGEKAGWIAEGRFEPGERFTCATIQTLHTLIHTPKFKEWAATINGFCLDECHTAAAETHAAAASAFPNIYWKVGLSGTPLDRADKKSIMAVAAIGPIVYEKKPGELIEEGFLAAPTVKIIPCHQPKHPGNWTELYNDHIKNSPHRNSAVVAAMLNSEAPGIVFVKHLEHGKTLCKMAKAKGIECDFVHGSWSRQRRQEVIKRLDRGEISWIVASAVFAEGVDIPCLRTVINGGGGKAIIATLQQVGRGTRLAEGKTTFTVWDIGDKGDERLNNHARARIRACQREGYKCVVDSALWPEKAKRTETI